MSKVRYLWRHTRRRLQGQKIQAAGTALPQASHATCRTHPVRATPRHGPPLPRCSLHPDSPLVRFLLPDGCATVGSQTGKSRTKTMRGASGSVLDGEGRHVATAPEKAPVPTDPTVWGRDRPPAIPAWWDSHSTALKDPGPGRPGWALIPDPPLSGHVIALSLSFLPVGLMKMRREHV